MYYVLSLVDYEEYVPRWFDCSCSKRQFDKTVRETISEVVDDYIKQHKTSYDLQLIDGHIILDKTVALLNKKGFKSISCDHEISFHGMCHYYEGERRPTLISKKSWQKILRFNKKMYKKDSRLFKKKIKREENGKERLFKKLMEE